MKKLILTMVIIVNINAWEVNTHRAIDRFAISKSSNLSTFLKNSGIKNTNYRSEIFEGYTNIITRRPSTYFDYLNKKYSSDEISEWGQSFDGSSRDYQDLIEAGAMLEDAVYSAAPLSFNGRFNNHFYDAQNNGHALTLGYGIRVNSLKWATNGTYVGSFLRDNKYSYLNALNYFKKAFTEASPTERRKYQAKMLVSVGHLLHLMNDLTSPAHVRDDSHPLGDAMEIYGRGGEDGKQNIGYKIVGNSLDDDAGIVENQATDIPKYSKFSDFITKEARWTATHFFSKDTMYTKPRPSISDTYESFDSSNAGIDKYYIRSYGNGTSSCRNGCVPRGIKLGIRVKSYIINALGEKYYRGSSEKLLLDKTTSFQGDQTVLKADAKLLIPRAIANARNFTNYFFRGQISAKIDGSNITIKNISNASLVKDRDTVTLHPGTFHLKYTTQYDNTIRDFVFERDMDRYEPNIEHTSNAVRTGGFVSLVTLKPGESIVVAIKKDTGILFKNIMVVYDGTIGHERGLAVCAAQTPNAMRN